MTGGQNDPERIYPEHKRRIPVDRNQRILNNAAPQHWGKHCIDKGALGQCCKQCPGFSQIWSFIPRYQYEHSTAKRRQHSIER